MANKLAQIDHVLSDGRTLKLTPADKPGIFVCEILTPKGDLAWSDKPIDLTKEAHRRKIQAQGVALDVLMGLQAQTMRRADSAKAEACISYRGMKSPASTAETVGAATPLEALDEILALTAARLPDEAFVFWEDTLDLRAVDVDWHGKATVPPAHEVERLLLSIRPTASRYWTTHGGGGRLIFAGQAAFTAEELAACAAAQILELAPTATVEIKCDTRHPASLRNGKAAGPVGKALADTNLGVIGRFAARGCSDADRDAWLANQGLELAANYPHHACPIDAGHVSQNAAPVFTGDTGVYCASCASRTGDGFRSYGRLTGATPTQQANPIYEAARSFVHWDQASYYFSALAADLPEPWRRPIYSALLRYLHQDEPAKGGRVSACFRPFPFVRGDSHWLNADSLTPRVPAPKKADLSGVPWALSWITNDAGEKELAADPVRLMQLEGNGTCPGLFPLGAVRGSPIYGVHNAMSQSRERVLVTPTLAHPQARYIQPRDRMPLAEAWAFLDRCFPGLNHDYLTLCHVARGCAEYGAGMVPIIYAHGPSGAAKTTTGAVETALAGDTTDDIGTIRMDGIGEAIGVAASTSGHIFLNEFSKLNKASRGLAVNAILQLSRRHTYRQPYVGVISVDNRCYVLLTDKDLPYELRSDEQFGRRVIYVPLREPVANWLKDGITAQTWLAAEGGQKAADSIHSWIVDEFFPAGSKPHFESLAARLKFSTLDAYFLNSEEGSQRSDLARALFFEVCLSKNHAPDAYKWGPGWAALEFGSESRLSAIGRQLASLRAEDATAEGMMDALEPVAGRWHTLLKLKGPARLEIRRNGAKAFVRFRSDDAAKKGYLINAALLRNSIDCDDYSSIAVDCGSHAVASQTDSSTDSNDFKSSDSTAQNDTFFSESTFFSETSPSEKVFTPIAVASSEPLGVESAQASTNTENGGNNKLPRLQTLHLDVETRSRADLKRTGAWRYSTDASTGCMCLVGKLGETWLSRVYGGEGPYEMPPEIAAALPGLTVAAHNASFEQAIWRNVLRWPEPGQGWFCTMALAATKGLPLGLDNLAAVIGQPGKEAAGHKIMMKSCKPDRRGEFPALNADEMAALVSYCRHDVEVEVALADQYGLALPAFEADVFKAHTAVNERGIRIDPDLCMAGLRLVESLAAEAGEAAQLATAGAIKPADLTRLPFLKGWLASKGYEVDSLESSDVDRLLRKKDLPADVRAVLDARSKVSRSSVSKLAAMLDASDPIDHRVRGAFMYHGALHGRWTGKLFQPQNLVKPAAGIDPEACVRAVLSGDLEAVKAAGNGDAEEALVACIRPAILAAPGKSLVVVDLSAIEARGVVWFANDEKHLEQFRQNDRGIGKDPYCHMADRLFGREILKGRDKKERDAGKEPVLGGGYGLGGARMDERCKAKGIDLPALGLTGKMVVDAYRQEYTAVCAKRTGAWACLDGVVRRCLESRKTLEIGATGNPALFGLEGSSLKLTLPSQRTLYFHNPRLEDETVKWDGGEFIAKQFYYDDMSSGRIKKADVWGGTWLEYIVSGHCRDLVARALVACEAESGSLPVILHCHDELVVEVDDDKAEAALAALIGHLTHVPSWSAGFPIAAEGHISKRYTKA